MDDIQVVADCKFCSEKGTGRYTCPRCNARYCSVECYKATGHLSCSELFYRDCFMEGLHTMHPDSSERAKLMEMLQRLEQDSEGFDDGEPVVDLVERFADVSVEDCSTELIWQRLTSAEQAEFETLVKAGQSSSLVELWTPWWCGELATLVQEVGNELTTSTEVPRLLIKLQHIDQLAKCATSNLVPFSIVNVLYGYAYAARLYNGDHLTMPGESATVMLGVSESLGRRVFADVALALAGCLSQLDDPDARGHFVSREYSIAVVDDVCRIVSGGKRVAVNFPLAALSDCHRVFNAARKEAGQELKQSDTSSKQARDDRQRYYAVEKKLEYFMSWTSSYSHSLIDLLPSMELASCELKSQLAVHLTEKDCVDKLLAEQKSVQNKGALIEEISAYSHSSQ